MRRRGRSLSGLAPAGGSWPSRDGHALAKKPYNNIELVTWPIRKREPLSQNYEQVADTS